MDKWGTVCTLDPNAFSPYLIIKYHGKEHKLVKSIQSTMLLVSQRYQPVFSFLLQKLVFSRQKTEFLVDLDEPCSLDICVRRIIVLTQL